MAFAYSIEKCPKSIDLSHHLSDVGNARQVSPLKGLFKYIKTPGIISMAGGVPDPAYFPFETLYADTLIKDSFRPGPAESQSPLSWFWNLFRGSEKVQTDRITIPKYTANPEDPNLAVALQYGTATGLVPLQKFIQEFVTKVYQPAYSDFTTIVHVGNTDGWSRAVMTLCNPGDGILTEEWTYPSACAGARPLGMHVVSVKIDDEGMSSEDLEQILSTWDEEARGMKRPHVMYTVPCGQNPTGSNMGSKRKTEIYNLCVKYDIIIVEDDPYYFMQEGEYTPKHLRLASGKAKAMSAQNTENEFLKGLVPSYLRMDYQGRVIRLDTFSKTIAPGSRLGWFTCNPLFAERFERQGETTTQAPSGFSQVLVTQLLTQQWGYSGYIRWLKGLQYQYTLRRDTILDYFAEEFNVSQEPGSELWNGHVVHVCYAKSTRAPFMKEKSALKPLISYVPPRAGMFIWLKVHLDSITKYTSLDEDDETTEKKIWVALAERGLLISPGWIFAANTEEEALSNEGHFRISFSNVEAEVMKKAVGILSSVLHEFSA
ncbi:PLP-dependent transferase [Sistotremastrum niveocremeum HHB9708]|uniref:PLP-dependent transferase n=2 Tax=Sistotremastraceae TaxID=3402574 RepID=A0A164UMH0_9AGAM|nr:PLP-dependent transferase [Sistotremastrum niveocremeum HHB9708]KZT43828.1 PLP-dependent transferase [Sistotremastrum suecicum HHB10207 ss-3]